MSAEKSHRIRIHRIGAHFTDGYNMDFFILSDGTVSGTARAIRISSPFVPFEMKINPCEASRLADLLSEASDAPSAASFSVGYGAAGMPAIVKHIAKPISHGNDESTNELFCNIEFICQLIISSLDKS